MTSRGEGVVIDFNSKNQIIGIELLGDKPCQKR